MLQKFFDCQPTFLMDKYIIRAAREEERVDNKEQGNESEPIAKKRKNAQSLHEENRKFQKIWALKYF